MSNEMQSARNDLVPTGKLRAAINLSNTLFTTQHADGSLTGVSIDVMHELASRLGVPLDIVVYPTPGDVADVARENAWDVAILAIEPARAKTIEFSSPMTAIEATYVVHEDSALKSIADVDKPGVRISAPEKAGYELFLTRTIQHATIVRCSSAAESIAAFIERRADALAGLKPMLLDAMTRIPDGRMLDGTFMTVNHGLGTSHRRGGAGAYLKAFVDDLNAKGFVAQSIARNKVQGLSPV